MKDLTKQLVTQQFYVEERIRSDGDSGELKSFTLVSLIVTMHVHNNNHWPWCILPYRRNMQTGFTCPFLTLKSVGTLLLIMKSKCYIINGNFWYIHNIYNILKRHDFVYFNNTELYCFVINKIFLWYQRFEWCKKETVSWSKLNCILKRLRIILQLLIIRKQTHLDKRVKLFLVFFRGKNRITSQSLYHLRKML